MHIIVRYFVLIFFVVTAKVFSFHNVVFESDKLSDIVQHVDNETLVVLDIDNTLIAPVQWLGSDQWAWHRAKTLLKEGMSMQQVYAQVSGEWQRVHAVTEVETIEENTASIIHDLQARNCPVIALTSRRPSYADITFRELNSVNIRFANSAIQGVEDFFRQDVLYKEGILFISIMQDKGAMLAELLRYSGYHPKKIVFVDDKLSYVQSVEAACSKLEIDFVGVRYSGADAQVATFNPNAADKQLLFLNRILSNEAASSLN